MEFKLRLDELVDIIGINNIEFIDVEFIDPKNYILKINYYLVNRMVGISSIDDYIIPKGMNYLLKTVEYPLSYIDTVKNFDVRIKGMLNKAKIVKIPSEVDDLNVDLYTAISKLVKVLFERHRYIGISSLASLGGFLFTNTRINTGVGTFKDRFTDLVEFDQDVTYGSIIKYYTDCIYGKENFESDLKFKYDEITSTYTFWYDIECKAHKAIDKLPEKICISKSYHISDYTNMIYDISILDLSRRVRELADFIQDG